MRLSEVSLGKSPETTTVQAQLSVKATTKPTLKRITSVLTVLLIVSLEALLLSGCGSFLLEGLKPLQPEYGQGINDIGIRVPTLQPEFRWLADPGSGVTYDFVIWKAIEIPYRIRLWASCGGYVHTMPLLRNTTPVYYVEGLKENVHRITVPLQPETCYAWSIRQRTGNVVSEWSTYGRANWMGEYLMRNQAFLFLTPAK